MNRFSLLPGQEWLICMDSLPFVAKQPPLHPEHTLNFLEPRRTPGQGSAFIDRTLMACIYLPLKRAT